MTLRSRLFSLFPAGFLALALVLVAWLIATPGPWPALLLVGHLYALPMLCYRLHMGLWPIRPGRSRLDLPQTYVPWWGGHLCQLPYDAFPQLEAALRLVPGLYSLWLRGWGARIGRAVHWTPRVEITDRGLVTVGDGALIGHQAVLCAHMVRRNARGELWLIVHPIHIGAGAVVGAASRLGPGARVADGEQLPALSERWAGRRAPPHP